MEISTNSNSNDIYIPMTQTNHTDCSSTYSVPPPPKPYWTLKKPTSTQLRMVVDYRQLNEYRTPYAEIYQIYPIPEEDINIEQENL